MAVALDASLGQGNQAAGASCSMTTTAAVASGATIVLLAGRFSATSASTLSVTGTGGLTWTEDKTVINGSVRCSIFRAPAPAGLASGTTLTVTNSVNGADYIIGAVSYTGIDTVGTVMTSGSGTSATTAWTSGSVASTSGNALIGGSFCDGGGGPTSTPTSPGVERFEKVVAGQTESLTLVDKVSVSGADTIAGTWSASTTSATVAVCYKAAAGGATPVTVTPSSADAVFSSSAAATAATAVTPAAASTVFSAAAAATAQTAVAPNPATAVFSSAATVSTAASVDLGTVTAAALFAAASGAVTASPVVAGSAATTFAATAAAAAPTVVAPAAAGSVYGASAVVTTPGTPAASSRLPLIGVGT